MLDMPMINFATVEGGWEMYCLKCHSAEFNVTDRSPWSQFEIRPGAPHGRCYIIKCRSCGHEALRNTLQPD